jgi:DNA-binding SARP family transcriptional activator
VTWTASRATITAVQFAILGPLAVTGDDGSPVPVGGPRPRPLLVLLAMAAGRAVAVAVAVDRIVDGQYGEHPPPGAANAVQAQVSRLRRALGADMIDFGPGGYRLAVDPDDVDAARFTRLAAEGRTAMRAGRPADAARLLRAALWRGSSWLTDRFATAVELRDYPATARSGQV